jgi:hypothetical protein
MTSYERLTQVRALTVLFMKYSDHTSGKEAAQLQISLVTYPDTLYFSTSTFTPILALLPQFFYFNTSSAVLPHVLSTQLSSTIIFLPLPL